MRKVFIVAEAGVNHNGSLLAAKKMIDIAHEAGADAIKFQTFLAGEVISRYAPKAEYQKASTDKDETQLEMIRKLELDERSHYKIIAHCKKRGIMFLSTPFDLASVDLLSRLGLKIFKIPSGEVTNLPYLRKIGALKKKIFLSTGMANLVEIRRALKVLTGAGTPLDNITVLQCNTEYPTPMQDANLLAMLTIKKTFGVRVGYSDHTLGIEVPIAAAALGAEVIEKHFTLDRKMKGPDHRASLEPDELKGMVLSIRNIEMAMGTGKKVPSKSEEKNIVIARKSLVAAREIKKGELFSVDNITAKRPGTGLSPDKWDMIVGRKAKKNFFVDEVICL